MKILSITIVCLLATTLFAPAQTKFRVVNEIEVGFGIYPTFQLWDSYIFSGYRDYTSTGGIHIAARHNLKDGESVKLFGAFESESGTWGSKEYATFRRQCYTVGIEYTIPYTKPSANVQLYCTLGLGGVYRHEPVVYGPGATHWANGAFVSRSGEPGSNSRKQLNAYYSPLGIRAGKDFGGYFEAGIGYKGILCVGVYKKL